MPTACYIAGRNLAHTLRPVLHVGHWQYYSKDKLLRKYDYKLSTHIYTSETSDKLKMRAFSNGLKSVNESLLNCVV